MKEYNVKITPYALNQMTEIRDYISHKMMNPTAAQSLMRKMQSKIIGLKQMPDRFKRIDEEPWKSRGVRKLIVKNFLIYFWIEEEKAIVHITAVTYAMRNQMNVLKLMDEE